MLEGLNFPDFKQTVQVLDLGFRFLSNFKYWLFCSKENEVSTLLPALNQSVVADWSALCRIQKQPLDSVGKVRCLMVSAMALGWSQRWYM